MLTYSYMIESSVNASTKVMLVSTGFIVSHSLSPRSLLELEETTPFNCSNWTTLITPVQHLITQCEMKSQSPCFTKYDMALVTYILILSVLNILRFYNWTV